MSKRKIEGNLERKIDPEELTAQIKKEDYPLHYNDLHITTGYEIAVGLGLSLAVAVTLIVAAKTGKYIAKKTSPFRDYIFSRIEEKFKL